MRKISGLCTVLDAATWTRGTQTVRAAGALHQFNAPAAGRWRPIFEVRKRRVFDSGFG